MSLTKDIILKAAEDVGSGMWCRNEWFSGVRSDDTTSRHSVAFAADVTIEQLQESKRCAEGSIQLATRLLGGGSDDSEAAIMAVEKEMRSRGAHGGALFSYNDHLPDDPFEAGQQLADLFRETAETL
jgi:hypothetical protein